MRAEDTDGSGYRFSLAVEIRRRRDSRSILNRVIRMPLSKAKQLRADEWNLFVIAANEVCPGLVSGKLWEFKRNTTSSDWSGIKGKYLSAIKRA